MEFTQSTNFCRLRIFAGCEFSQVGEDVIWARCKILNTCISSVIHV